MACPDMPKTSVRTLPILTFASSRIFCTRFRSAAPSCISVRRLRVKSRSSRISRAGMKLGCTNPCRSNPASHRLSFGSVFLPRSALTCSALARIGSRRNLVSTSERDLIWVQAICKLKAPGEAEAGSAGTQPRRGITRWAHRNDENEAWSCDFAPRLPPHRTIDPHALENPGGLGAGPQIKKRRQYLVGFLRQRGLTVEGS